jgi:DNA-binding transcriptional LysR family regulator
MNLKFLRTFVTIADNAGFARAAAQLNLTQSAASRQIQALEEELGVLLFVRVGRSSRLTQRAKTYCCAAVAYYPTWKRSRRGRAPSVRERLVCSGWVPRRK